MKLNKDNDKKIGQSRINESNSGRSAMSPLGIEDMDILKLFDQEQLEQLHRNAQESHHKNNIPVAYICFPQVSFRFLITELDPLDAKKAYGLSDYDTELKIGEINLDAIAKESITGKNDILSQWDFEGKYNLAVYIKVAEEIGTIVIDSSQSGYKEEFEKFAVGKNIDKEQDLRFLKNKLTWL